MDKNYAPEKLELLITVVDQERGIYYNSLIRTFSVNFQIVVPAKGTAASELLDMLGLSSSEKTVIFSVVRQDRLKVITETLEEKFKTVRGGKGIAVAVPMTSIIGTLAYGFLANERSLYEQRV